MRPVDADNSEDRRRQILEAALVCFRDKGFAGASIADICRQAQMSPGHLYHYFESKRHIIAAAVALDREASQNAIAWLKREPDLVTAIIRALDPKNDLGTYSVDGGLALEVYAEAARDGDIKTAVAASQNALHKQLADLIASAQRAGQIDSSLNPSAAADLITIIFEGLSIQGIGLTPKRAKALAQTLPMMIQRILRPGVGPPITLDAVRVGRNRKS